MCRSGHGAAAGGGHHDPPAAPATGPSSYVTKVPPVHHAPAPAVHGWRPLVRLSLPLAPSLQATSCLDTEQPASSRLTHQSFL